MLDRDELPAGLRRRHRAVEHPLGHGQDQPRGRPAARVLLQARLRRRRARRHHRPGPIARRGRGGLPGRRRRAGPPAGPSPTSASPRCSTRRWRPRASTSCRCSPSGCPRSWADKPMDSELDAYADRVIDTMEEVAPGFAASILHRKVIGPHEMEHEYGLIGGNIFHGELIGQPAVPPPTGGRLCRLPDAHHRAVPGRIGHPRGRRRHRHPRAAGRAPDRAGRTCRSLAARRPSSRRVARGRGFPVEGSR